MMKLYKTKDVVWLTMRQLSTSEQNDTDINNYKSPYSIQQFAKPIPHGHRWSSSLNSSSTVSLTCNHWGCEFKPRTCNHWGCEFEPRTCNHWGCKFEPRTCNHWGCKFEPQLIRIVSFPDDMHYLLIATFPGVPYINWNRINIKTNIDDKSISFLNSFLDA